MTTLTQTGSIDTILSLDMDTDVLGAVQTLSNDFSTLFYNIDALNQVSSFEYSTHTPTSVIGYDPASGGKLNIVGFGMNINYAVASSGYYTSATFQSGADPGSGTFTYDGNESFHFVGKVTWSYTPGNGGPHLTGGGFSTLDYTEGADHLEFIGTNLQPDDTSGDIHGIAKQMIVTSNGVTMTLLSSTGVNLETEAGTLNTIAFKDGADSITLSGAFSFSDFIHGDHTLVGDYFQDSLILGGADVLTVPDSTQDWHGFAGADKITGGTQGDALFGDDGNDTLTGLVGNDTLDGGTGVDVMIGGTGDDTYFVDNALDKITELAGGGTDMIYSSVSYKMGANTEILILTGSGDINGTGTLAANEQLGGTDGNNTLDGGGGGDSLYGQKGDDTYILRSSADVIGEVSGEGNDTAVIAYSNADLVNPATLTLGTGIFANVENLKVTGTGLFNLTGDNNGNMLTGNASVNTLDGGSGDDVLDGGAGADKMIGGTGHDTFIVDNAGDVVVDTGGTNDTVILNMLTGSFTMGANTRILTMNGIGALHVTGNGDGDMITGNAGANVIESGVSISDNVATMAGGAGADTYIVDNTTDVILENAGTTGGIDIVNSSVSYTLGDNIEKLVLTGPNLINGTGNGIANVITGNGQNNVLDGKAGVDTLIGGLGDDTYNVDVVMSGTTTAKIEDIVTDTGGNDTLALRTTTHLNIAAPVTFTLAAALETFDISGTGDNHFNITGNLLANSLLGNDWDNTLDGAAGDDFMHGGDGNDTYIVDSLGDAVDETGTVNSTSDTVVIKYGTLAPADLDISNYTNIENIKVTGTGAWNLDGDTGNNVLTGNASLNTLTGNGGNDTLDGGLGADVMHGGGGNDTFFVDNLGDSIVGNGGTDAVFSSISYSLSGHADITNLTLTGTALAGAGNSGNNVLTGNASANTLTGLDGNDTLIGGVGADKLFGNDGNDTLDGGTGIDTLTGGAGSDVFVFHLAQAALSTNADIVADFDVTAHTGDALDISDILSGGISGSLSDYVHLTQSGLNTVVSVDVDGAANGAHFVNIATLTGVTASHWATVVDMVNDGNLIIPV